MTLAEEIIAPPETGVLEDGSDRDGLLEGRFQVDLSARLGFLDRGPCKAYKAQDIHSPGSDLFAVISDPYILSRKFLANAMSAGRIPGMIDLIAHGPLKFGETDIHNVFIFERPKGGLVFNEAEGPLPEKFVLDTIIPTITECLLTLGKADVVHRGIRADNLFFEDESHGQVVLGDTVTTPPGSCQPPVYEPPESARADAYGRGAGAPGHDIYALGVLIVHLLGGELPGKNLSPEALYTRKLEQGSFMTLAADLRVSSRVADLLVGLLQDDPKRRWDVATLARWRDAIKDQPRPGHGDRRAMGGIMFDEKEYVSPRLLAEALTKKPKDACKLLDNGKLTNWVKNSLRDNDAAAAVPNIRRSSVGATRGHTRNEITAVAQINSLLDPRGPFWFRDVAFSRGGLGSLLAYAFQQDSASMKKSLADLLESGLLMDYAMEDAEYHVSKRRGWLSDSAATNCFDHMKKKNDLGFGLERCLYELNPELPCLSPLTVGSNVRDIPQLIGIAEKKLMSAGGKTNPFDRHSSAFIAAKSKGLGKYLHQLASTAPGSVKHSLALLKMFAKLQAIVHPEPLPGFCLWAETLMKPVLGKIQSRLRREVVSQRLDAAKKSGNLETILTATDVEQQMAADAEEYEKALAEAAHAERMAFHLAGSSDLRRVAAGRYGTWITSVLSIATLLTSMALSALYFIG
ncbi:MAG: hypothetical protein K9G33_15160 [Sneathiella sp.]|nr:hypothetical protein [Sneathiella sp.]